MKKLWILLFAVLTLALTGCVQPQPPEPPEDPVPPPTECEHVYATTEETRDIDIYQIVACEKCGRVESEEIVKRIVAEGIVWDYLNAKNVAVFSAQGLKNYNAILSNTYTPPEGGIQVPLAFFSNKTVTLTCDVDLSGYAWKPISLPASLTNLTLDGQGHTIRNLSLNGSTDIGSTDIGMFGLVETDLTVKNVKFENAKLSTTGKWCGILVGHLEKGNLTAENLTFDKCAVLGTIEPKAIRLGCVVGYAKVYEGSLTVKSCKVENSTFYGYHNTCALVGTLDRAKEYEKSWTITNCEVKNNAFHIGAGNPKYVNPYVCDTVYMERDEMEAFITGKGNVQTGNTFRYDVTENPEN